MTRKRSPSSAPGESCDTVTLSRSEWAKIGGVAVGIVASIVGTGFVAWRDHDRALVEVRTEVRTMTESVTTAVNRLREVELELAEGRGRRAGSGEP